MKGSNLMSIKKIGLLSTLVVVSIALSACGGSGGGGSDGEGASPGTPTPTVAPTPSPNAMPLSKQETNVGEAYAVNGSVNVLRPSDSSVSEETDDVDPGTVSYKGSLQSKAGNAVTVDSSDGDAFDVSFEDLNGYSLYIFDNDVVGESSCNSTICMAIWPPFIADDNAVPVAPLSVITRDDGLNQWVLRNKPLYLFSGDSAAGDTNGEGVGGVWHLAVNQPIQLNDLSVSESEGVYFTAHGEVLVSGPEVEGSTEVFVANLEDRTSYSLYTFDVDTSEVSNCNGACLGFWPALLAEDGETALAPYSIFDRQIDESGGTARQWAFHGKPLYFFIGDVVAGDTNGTAVSNWRLARPEPWKTSASILGTVLSGSGRALVASVDDGAETTAVESKNGFSLYTFDNDSVGVSNCSESCLDTWPALMASDGADAIAPYSLIERNAGGLQWAFNGLPLYFFSGDSAPGDLNGDETGSVWHLARSVPLAVNTHSEESEIFVAHGKIVDENGGEDQNSEDFTLYIFTNDNAGLPTCYGGCETTWPPLFAEADAQNFGDFTVVARDDPSTSEDDALGIKQWAYKNQPLYFFSGDSSPGNVNGEYGTWFIAKP